ncbi:MAG TPA: vanadium-dependent haloperoxidase [Bryobacteraceae bacterium]|nr:vanadium-dependent haloperoxidase [Bryobacteraceae bacterium]
MAAMLFTSALTRADVVSDWNRVMLTTLSAQNPYIQARVAAITHLAVFEAVNAVTGEVKPYLGTVTASPGASAEAAAVSAAYTVLIKYLPDWADALNDNRADSLARIPEGPAKSAGIAAGEAAANAMIAARASDGSEPPEVYTPPPSPKPGEWQLTGACNGGVFLHVAKVTLFALRSSDQFRSDPPPALASGKYARAYNELKEFGGVNSPGRPQDRADVALFYSKVLSTFIWNPVATQIAARQNKSLSENARAFALLNMAIFDAFVANFDTKYRYPFWRPETAIHAGDQGGNRNTEPDPGFAPFVPTPCHPSYPAALPALGSAARVVLERIYGRRGHSITLSTPAVPNVTLHYENLRDISDDINDARLFGGIHFRFDDAAGNEQGRQVGDYVFRHKLRRAQSCASGEEEDQ